MPDRGLFAFVALGGFGGILWGKLNGYGSNYIAAGAVAAMVLYGMAAYRIPAVRLRLDRLGDNFYYLGSIYTLGSLSAALLQLNEGTPLDALIGSFGIALVTTIVGIAGRVLFVQMRGDLDEVEDRVRQDLARASEELRGQLSITLRELEIFRTSVVQAITETMAQATDATRRQIEGIELVAELAAKRIAAAFEPNETQLRQLNASVVEISKAVEQLSARMAESEFPSERLHGQLKSFAEQLDMLHKDLAAQVASRMAKVGVPIEEMEREVVSFRQGLAALLQDVARTIEDIARRSSGQRRRRWYWPFGR